MLPSNSRQIGPYRLLSELGRGAMGVVYLAEHTSLGNRVALKVLLDGSLGDAVQLSRFRLEASVASKLQHPGIVGVHDVGQHGNQPYFVMEYSPGETLEALLKRQGKLPPRRAAQLLIELARAVGFAHARGVLHRDLKPANVILSSHSGKPRVTDFGVARDRSLQASLTHSADLLGTPSFMAPEQLRSGRNSDARVDVYSLGVVLYLCLTGRCPYEASSIYALITEVCEGGCPSPASLAEVPEALNRICLRALALDPAERPADGTALANELQAFLNFAPPSLEAPTRHEAQPKTSNLWPVAFGLLIAATAGVCCWLLWNPTGPPPPSAPPNELPETPPATQVTDPGLEPEPELVLDPAVTEVVDQLEQLLLAGFSGEEGALDQIGPRASGFAENPRVRVFADFSRLRSEQLDPLQARRRWLAALDKSPASAEVAAALTARLCYALGFQRAASDCLRARASEVLPVDWAIHTTVEHHLLTLPPVRDDALAELLIKGLVERRRRTPPQPGARLLPDTDSVLVYRAVAKRVQGRGREAANELLNAVEQGTGPWRIAQRLADRTPDECRRFVSVSFGVSRLLSALEAAEKGAGPFAAPSRLTQLGDALEHDAFEAEAAVAWVRATYAARRLGQRNVALEALERAHQLELRAAPDVRCLVARLLGRALLDSDPARAARLGEEAAAPWTQADSRTPGEHADAWLVVAQARRALGQDARAQEALEAADRAQPSDRRELDALLQRR